MAKPDMLTLAAASGSDGGFGVISTLPASGVLYVRCPSNSQTETIDWILKCDKAHSYQFYLAEQMLLTLPTLTLSGWLNTETLFVMGNTYTAATSTTTWSTRTLSIAGDNDADAALLAKMITGGKVVTLASVSANDTVSITDINGVVRTYTAHASTTTAANREFNIGGATNTLDAAELVTVINDGTYGVSGVTATQGAATGEVLVHWTTPTGATPPTVTTSNGTRLAVTTVGETLLYATVAANVVSLAYRPAMVDTVAKTAPYVYTAKTGTATSHCVVTETNLLGSLIKDGAIVTSLTDNSTTAGSRYTQTVRGMDQAYLAVTNNDGSNAATIIVKAIRNRYRE